MTPEQAKVLTEDDYVASLNVRRCVGYKVTRVAQTSIDTRIQVSGLYGDEWVLATAFFKVSGTTPTREETLRFEDARLAAVSVVAP